MDACWKFGVVAVADVSVEAAGQEGNAANSAQSLLILIIMFSFLLLCP